MPVGALEEGMLYVLVLAGALTDEVSIGGLTLIGACPAGAAKVSIGAELPVFPPGIMTTTPES
jgi:hypothetical protein